MSARVRAARDRRVAAAPDAPTRARRPFGAARARVLRISDQVGSGSSVVVDRTTTASNVVNGVDVQRLGDTIKKVSKEPDLARFQFRVRNRWSGDGGFSKTTVQDMHGVGTELSHTQRFEVEADEPDVLVGKDRAPNPVEHLLSALAGCLTGSMVYHAAARGIRLDAVESELEGDLDLRGFTGVSTDVRKGYQAIRATFHVTSDASEEALRECAMFSPVFDSIANGVPIDLKIEKTPG